MHYSLLGLAACLSAVLATPGTLKLDFSKAPAPVPALRRRTLEAPLANAIYEYRYLINFTVGTPPQHFSLLLDTGSSDIWLPASTSPGCNATTCAGGTFTPSDSSTYTALDSLPYNNTYGVPGMEVSTMGTYFTDTIKVGSISVANMTMAVVNATEAITSSGTSGIFGVGPVEGEAILDEALINGESVQQINASLTPTFYDQLASLGHIGRPAYSIYLNDENATSGSVLFGGVDTTKYEGSLVALPMQQVEDLYDYFAVALTGLSFQTTQGNTPLTSSSFAIPAVIDTGTPAMDLPEEVFDKVFRGLGGVQDEGGYFVACALREVNASLIFTFGGPQGLNISVPLSALILPYDLAPVSVEGVRLCQLGVGPTTGGLYPLGDTFMRSAYVVYDPSNYQMAMGQAKYGSGTGNIVAISAGTSLPGVSSTASYLLPTTSGASSPVATGAMSTGSAAASSTSGSAGSATFNLGTSVALTGSAASATSSSSAGAPVAPVLSAAMGVSFMAGAMALFM